MFTGLFLYFYRIDQISKSMNKRIKSFGYAFQGIKAVISTEVNMQIHLAISVLVIIFGYWFDISSAEWIACLLCMAVVWGLEMMNTALETVVDLVSPEVHPLAGRAKDIAAGAVLLAAIISVIVGLIVFLPKILVVMNT